MIELTLAEAVLAEKHRAEIKWFMDNAYGVAKVRLPERLVPKLIQLALENKVSWRREILKASAWAMSHPEKKDYGRFYAGWMGRAGASRYPVQQAREVNWIDPI